MYARYLFPAFCSFSASATDIFCPPRNATTNACGNFSASDFFSLFISTYSGDEPMVYFTMPPSR